MDNDSRLFKADRLQLLDVVLFSAGSIKEYLDRQVVCGMMYCFVGSERIPGVSVKVELVDGFTKDGGSTPSHDIMTLDRTIQY